MRRVFGLVVALVSSAVVTRAESPPPGSPVTLPGLRAPAQITRDINGLAHIQATQDHDLYFLQGWVHAQDRLFQMDRSRRLASGTYAELVGAAALPSDVTLRTIGLRQAAERSLAALSQETRAALEAYAEGVNASVASHPLPPEYAALGLAAVEPWTPLDSVAVVKLIAFGLSFDIEDIDRSIALGTYMAVLGEAAGKALFFEDLFRSQPFDPASTVPDASARSRSTVAARAEARGAAPAGGGSGIAVLELGRRYLDRVKDIPIFQRIRDRERGGGSNEWAVSGAHTESGFPLLANDPHLTLDTPSTFYPIHLRAGRINVIGSGFAGAPFITLGHNEHIAWGATQNPMDVTDIFQETIVRDSTSPSGLSTVFLGQNEPVIPIPEVFRQNNFDGTITVVPPGTPIPGGEVPPATLVVPRRNHGPIIQLDLALGIGLSAQYTGFSPTRELDSFRIWNDARHLQDFRRGLAFFDVGSQNWSYADRRGNIAYFTSAEMPLREDLQAGTVNGLPPFFIRNGTGGNEWIPLPHPRPDQAVPYETLPFAEMPQVVNPEAGFFVSANNDPAGHTLDNDPLNQLRPGGGIYYLNPGYDGLRAGRVMQLIRAELAGGGTISFADMQRIQADTAMIDAQFFVPHLLAAFTRAQASANVALQGLASNPVVVEAVGRLGGWDFTTPTGIPQGYDATDVDGVLSAPSPAEEAASVAATIYGVWRSRFIADTIDAVLGALPRPDGQRALSALRHLLEIFDSTHGVGASGLSFFNAPGVTDPAERRDFVILGSLAEALTGLAGPDFANAFGFSTDQDSYRWGRLHRLVLEHPLDGPFSIPPALDLFPHPLGPALPGIPVDGGFGTVDAAHHDPRAADEDAFMFASGPAHRFVAEAASDGVRAVSSLPGGLSGIPGSPSSVNLLPAYLTNDAFPLWLRASDVAEQR